MCGLFGLLISAMWYLRLGAFATQSFKVVHPPPPPNLTGLGCDILEFETGSTFSDIFQQQFGPSMSYWGQNDANFACDLVSPDQDDASLPKFLKSDYIKYLLTGRERRGKDIWSSLLIECTNPKNRKP